MEPKNIPTNEKKEKSVLSMILKAKSFKELQEYFDNKKNGKREEAKVFNEEPVPVEPPPYTGPGTLIEQYWLTAPFAYAIGRFWYLLSDG